MVIMIYTDDDRVDNKALKDAKKIKAIKVYKQNKRQFFFDKRKQAKGK